MASGRSEPAVPGSTETALARAWRQRRTRPVQQGWSRTISRSSRRHPLETDQLPLTLLVAEKDVDRFRPGWPGSIDAAQFNFHEPAVVARQPARRLEPGRARLGFGDAYGARRRVVEPEPHRTVSGRRLGEVGVDRRVTEGQHAGIVHRRIRNRVDGGQVGSADGVAPFGKRPYQKFL